MGTKGKVHPEVAPLQLRWRGRGGLKEGDVSEEWGVLEKKEDPLILLGPRGEEI